MKKLIYLTTLALCASNASAALVTNPNDARTWQGATVGTFANLYYGADNATTRQQVVDNQLLDDGIFNPTGYTQGTLIQFRGGSPNSTSYSGQSADLPNVSDGWDGTYSYTTTSATAAAAGNTVDNQWIQVDNVVGNTVYDLGFQAAKAAIFNTIDHGPLPEESIESTIYLSNDRVSWTQAVTERVWLEGFYSDTSVIWDGFAYAVGTGTNATFRYASVIWGGPGALWADGDNEFNGILGLRSDFTGQTVPEPTGIALFGIGLAGLLLRRTAKA